MKMRIIAASALFALAACGQARESAPEYRPTEAGTVDHALCLLGFTAVPLREVPTGHQVVDASLNGKPGTFVLDTGANVTVLSKDHTAAFGVSSNGRGISGLGASLASTAGKRASLEPIDGLDIGSISIRQKRIAVADLGQLLTALSDTAGEEVVGIIGQDVLNEHRAIIDVARPMLYLRAKDDDPAPVDAANCTTPPEPSGSSR